MPIASLGDVRIHYRLQGDGEQTVVLVNGLTDDLETWALQVPALCDAGYRVLSFDNRGIGLSSAPAGPYTTAQLAADAKALIDSLGLTSIHLLGVSMGGMIAQEYALAHPADLRTLTLACTYAAPGPFCARLFASWDDLAAGMGVAAVMRQLNLWSYTTDFFHTRVQELGEIDDAARRFDQPLAAYLAQSHAVQTHDTTARIARLQIPTLVLAGEQDILIPVSLSRALHALIDGSQWRTTPGGHACMWEHPDAFNRAAIDFIASHAGA